MSNPYFEVNETAMVNHNTHPERNGDVKIVSVLTDCAGLRYHDPRSEETLLMVEPISYEVDRDLDGSGLFWVKQSALRKKHKPAEDNEKWSALISNLNTQPITEA